MSNENTAIQMNCCGKCSELRPTLNGVMCLFMDEAIFLGEAFRKPTCECFDPVDARQSRKDNEPPTVH